MIIDRVATSDAGTYICDAINSFGGEQKEISIKVLLAPKVSIDPSTLFISEGATSVLECIVDSDNKNYTITWIDVDGNVLQNVTDLKAFSLCFADSYQYFLQNISSYEFTASREHHNKSFTCLVYSGDFLISNSSVISVEYSPRFVDGIKDEITEVKVTHGSDLKLSCKTDGNPEGVINWFFTARDSSQRKNLQNSESDLNFEMMDESKQGTYECVVENNFGRAKRSFPVGVYPKGDDD